MSKQNEGRLLKNLARKDEMSIADMALVQYGC